MNSDIQSIFKLAKILSGQVEGFSLTFIGFSPGWGYVHYTEECVSMEQFFKDLEQLTKILQSLKAEEETRCGRF